MAVGTTPPVATSPTRSGSPARWGKDHPKYKWVALSNTTLGVLMATINSSIVIISLPAIFRGIAIDPLGQGNVSYLLWMIMGFLLASAVLVVTFGRLGDMFGRVRIYNLGFVVFTAGSLALGLDPLSGSHGALWLIVFRIVQGVGGAMLFANSTAILTDAFPSRQRGFALGINQVAALAGSFLGLIIGGLLSEVDWRLVFFVSVPFGLLGTIWSYKSLHEMGTKKSGKLDWPGNITFALGLTIVLVAITYGIQPYGTHATGWANPKVYGGMILGVLLLAAFCVVESRVKDPMFDLSLFRIRAFSAGNLAGLLASVARGGLQFMLIIWLQGIWLPLHGYSYESTPLWAAIYMLPLTAGFLLAGPVSGALSDRFGARWFATGGLLLTAVTFIGLFLIPVDFPYPVFALLIAFNGIGSGLFAAPNTTAIMNSVPANQRGIASGMRGTFFNSGTSLSIGVFFTLMILGLAKSLPSTLFGGLTGQGVNAQVASQVAGLPPVSSLFAAFLGFNPIQQLLGPSGALQQVDPQQAATLTGGEFFPQLISGPFHSGLVVVFLAAAAMSVIAAVASLFRGGRYVHDEEGGVTAPAPAVGQDVTELLVALSRARRWLSRLATGEHSPVGASGVSALAEVVRSGPIRLGDLAAREQVAPATLSRVVAGLVEHGFVERTPDPEDARAGILTATPAGVELLAESRRRRTAELVARLDRLTDAERDAVLGAAPALRRLADEGPPSSPLLASSERCPGRGPFQPLTPAASPPGRPPGGR